MANEINFKKDFCEKYFKDFIIDFDSNFVDITIKHKKQILYIESKLKIVEQNALNSARAQIILTNKKQPHLLREVALIYSDKDNNDILELIECDDSVLFNNDINWKSETPSNPSKDAIEHINNRLVDRIKIYRNDEILEFANGFKNGQNVIQITLKNCILVYNEWKHCVKFRNEIKNEQDSILLFLADALNGEIYKKDAEFFGEIIQEDLIFDGTRLNDYRYCYDKDGISLAIVYDDTNNAEYYAFREPKEHIDFWKKYKRPPNKDEFLKIIEHSARFYSDGYRKTTGGEYTPSCFVKLQNNILNEHLKNFENEFIVFDPCAGVGNLENEFSRDYKKEFCYLSTLEQIDVDTCKIKGFSNVLCYDYLKDSKEPLFDYRGTKYNIKDICQKENKKLMIIMNPPYQKIKGFKYDLAIEFFNKVLKLEPEVIVYYCKTEFFFRSTIEPFLESGYKILSHNFSNAKKTFGLSEWSVSQVIFHKNKGEILKKDIINADRYELIKENGTEIFKKIKTYTYDFSKPSLLDEIDKAIKENQSGMILGQYSKLNSVLIVSNGGKEKPSKITTQNLKYCLMLKGLNINTHSKYFEWAYLVFRGRLDEIPQELFNDALAFSLFFKGNMFSNKIITEGLPPKNCIMPFSADELNLGSRCHKGMLYVLEQEYAKVLQPNLLNSNDLNYPPFDFREFLKEFDFSKEAKELFSAALDIFRFYHNNKEYENKDFNDSFYDITNAIMGKNPSDFLSIEQNDSRIAKTKTTKGAKGFAKNIIKSIVSKESLPIFERFFEARDNLAKKINKELLDSKLLLWERENIY